MTPVPPLNNALNLSEESIQLILQDFGRYRDPIPEGVMKYLVDGGDDSILQQLSEAYTQMPDERSVEFHQWSPQPSYELRSRMLNSLTTQDVEFYYRLARTYDTEARNLKRHYFTDWLSLFLHCMGSLGGVSFSLVQPLFRSSAVTAHVIEALLQRFDEPADRLAQVVFLADVRQPDPCEVQRVAWAAASLPEFSVYSLKHEAVVRAALRHSSVDQRIHALDILTICQMSPVTFASLLVDCATANSKTERAVALEVLKQEAIAMIPLVQAKAQTGKASERAHAAKVLADLAGADARSFLEQRLEVEQTATVRDAIQWALTDLTILSAPEVAIALSPLPPVALEAPLPLSVREAIATTLMQLHQLAEEKYEATQSYNHPSIPVPQPPSAELIDRTYHCLQFGTAAECLALAPIYHYLIHSQVPAQFVQLLHIPELEVVHVARLLLLLQLLATEYHGGTYPNQTIPNAMHWAETDINTDLQRWFQQRQPNNGLRYLASSLEVLGLSGDMLAWKMLCWEDSPFWTWGDLAIAEYFGERLSILDQLFELPPFPQVYLTWEQTARRQLFRILEILPQLPNRYIPLLWNIALTGLQAEMPLAQRCLDHRPGTLERLHQLVNHSDPAIQVTVIHWLTRLQDHTAIPLFQNALQLPVVATVRDVLFRSLETLGASIDEFLDPSQLLQEAQTGLQKEIPKALSWFPFNDLPAVQWQDATPVATEILTWFVVQSYQQKNAEPSPVLRQYVKLWNAEDRQQFGQAVLEAWIAQDTQVASAVKEKGILAVAGACGGAAMVPVINTYLKTHFGKRLPQCIALLHMLAWSDDFAAIQLLLAIANRFRTPKIQQAAQECVNQLAERQGWTLAELADRTIPWCGLAEDGTLTLEYGPRQFGVALDAECQMRLTDEQGNVLKALPNPRKDDDADRVKAAKQQWTATKKQLNLVRSQQEARLYEALCTQRSWTFADWERYLYQHPVMGRLCQRLIWAVFDGAAAEPTQTFCPQPDQTLVDAEVRVVTVSLGAIVRLAQATLLPKDVTQAWQQYWSQSQLPPLFEQWAVVYFPPANSDNVMGISDFAGRSLSRHQLRQRAMQQGYLPFSGDAEHGWIVDYRKRFEDINLEAVIDFSGDRPVSPEDFEVQIQDLYFWQGRLLPLAEVPPVLLSLVWHEVQAIAAVA